ncbi:MAG: hypothetical protein IJ512_07955, partial [Ruminococcus sp.]|nr:hypothetical protein [Ruminococcus sp.]
LLSEIDTVQLLHTPRKCLLTDFRHRPPMHIHSYFLKALFCYASVLRSVPEATCFGSVPTDS